MAKETLSQLVYLLWNGFYDQDGKILKNAVSEDFQQYFRKVQAADFGSLGNTERLLPNMLHLMGYSDEGDFVASTDQQKKLAKQFRDLFWPLPECYEYFLESLLASGQEESRQMKAIFNSFEKFHSEAMDSRSRQLSYRAERVLDYACEDIATGSNWFSKYYALSDIIDPKNKRIDVVYYNLLYASDYYSEDEVGLKKVLQIQDPKEKISLYEKMMTDLREKAHSLRAWLAEHFPRLVSFLSVVAPVWTPTNWKKPDVPSLRLATKVYNSQDTTDLLESVLIEVEGPEREDISGNNITDLLNRTDSLLKSGSEAVRPAQADVSGNGTVDLRLEQTASLFTSEEVPPPVSVEPGTLEARTPPASLRRASLQNSLDLPGQASMLFRSFSSPPMATSRRQRSQSCSSFFQEQTTPSEDFDSGFSPIKRHSVSLCSLDVTSDTEASATDQEESGRSSSPGC